jgi:hypothetical protein
MSGCNESIDLQKGNNAMRTIDEAFNYASACHDEKSAINTLVSVGCKILYGQVYNSTGRRTMAILAPSGRTYQLSPSSALVCGYIVVPGASVERYTPAKLVEQNGYWNVVTEGGVEIFNGYRSEALAKCSKHNEGIDWAKEV